MLPDFVTIPVVATAHSRIAAVELGQICVLSHLESQQELFVISHNQLLPLSSQYTKQQLSHSQVRSVFVLKVISGNRKRTLLTDYFNNQDFSSND